MTNTKLAVAVIAVLLLCAVVVYGANAGDIPKDVEVFTVGDHTCVMVEKVVTIGGDIAVALECFCPCEVNCATILPSDTPVPTEETPEPRDTPTKEPTLPPPPTEEPKQKCNRGLGNGSENCDPGNSAGQGQGQGRQAGEDKGEDK